MNMKNAEMLSGKGEYASPSCYLIHVRMENSIISGLTPVTSGSIDDLEENEYNDSIWK